MKFLSKLLYPIMSGFVKGKHKNKSVEDYRQELLIKQGKEQFTKLLDKGLKIPVALL